MLFHHYYAPLLSDVTQILHNDSVCAPSLCFSPISPTPRLHFYDITRSFVLSAGGI